MAEQITRKLGELGGLMPYLCLPGAPDPNPRDLRVVMAGGVPVHIEPIATLDWADLREKARNAGWVLEGNIHWGMWIQRKPDGRFDDSRGWVVMQIPQNRITFVSPGSGPRWSRSVVELADLTPAKALQAARLVGLGGDR